LQYQNQIGCDGSTVSGLSEIEQAAKAMAARAELIFQEESVEFSLAMQIVLPEHEKATTELSANATNPAVLAAHDLQSSEQASKESEPTQFPEGTVLVCVDDDKVSRMMLNAIIHLKGLNADQTKSIVLGETLQEVQGLVQTVMDIAAQVGERKVICIFDQMLDYGTDMFLGTDAIAELRSLGFKGVVLIRSANDEHFARELYRDAGASGFLSKSTRRGPEIVKSIVSQWYDAWEQV
jgi:CheY-like chemotaxis protein